MSPDARAPVRPVATPEPPSHTLVEAVKGLHLASIVAAALLLLGLFGMPATFGHETLRGTVTVVVIGGALLAVAQIASLGFLAARRRRLAAAPRLARPEPAPLDFDRHATSPEARQD